MPISTPDSTHFFGWVRDLPDVRDYKLLDYEPAAPAASLPASVDLRAKCPPIYDQRELGSCTANSVAAGVEFLQMKQGIPAFTPSRLFIYYQTRLDQGDTANDTGASIRASAKAVVKYGAPPETEWPYVISQFAQRPPASVYTSALRTRITRYLSVAQDLVQMKSCLASGFLIHVGFSVYSSFLTPAVAQSGVVPMPAPSESLQGGHAVAVVGYDDTAQRWLCRNSWGTDWGMSGYFTMPYAYLTTPSLSGDFWTLREVTGSAAPNSAVKVHQVDIYSDGGYKIVM